MRSPSSLRRTSTGRLRSFSTTRCCRRLLCASPFSVGLARSPVASRLRVPTTSQSQLRSGALPADLTVVEERSVGPSLGADSIASGRLAGIVGAIATVILTIFVYGTFGLFAVTGLILNAMFIVAIMSGIGSVLTLPGIAGLVLTIGMAVDANVLIYERIREELRSGKSAIAAIDSGFGRAMVTIF